MSAQSNLFDSSDSKSNTAAAAQYPSAVDEEHLVSAARSGDSNAFVELYDRHSKKLLARIYRITRNWEDAEDALQDAAVRAFVHVASFEGRSNFASWLTRIATNSAFMVLRKRRASAEVSIEQSFEQSENRVMREPPDYAESPEALLGTPGKRAIVAASDSTTAAHFPRNDRSAASPGLFYRAGRGRTWYLGICGQIKADAGAECPAASSLGRAHQNSRNK